MLMKSAEEYIKEATEVSGAAEGTVRCAVDYAADPERLANDRPPTVSLQKEAPVHALMVYMQAAGKSNKEIAESTGYSTVAVGNILRQPWARQRFLRITQKSGLSAVETFLNTQVLPSIEALVEVRENGNGTQKVAAANAILDRALGKPTQYIKSENVKTVDDASKEREQLEMELKSVQEQLTARGIGGNN